MTESRRQPSEVAASWNAYWQGTGQTGAYSCGGAGHPAVLAFWNEFFSQARTNYSNPRLLDIASGNGAVIERALGVFQPDEIEIRCVDISEAAIANISSRFENIEGITADASQVPLDDRSADIVTSQFGLEYAGLDALDEAARLLADGGQMGLLMHHSGGSIHQECSNNLAAVKRIEEAGFVSGARALFSAGFDAVKGAGRAAYDKAGAEFAPAIAEAERVMQEFGQDVADETIARLYSDIARIHGEIQYYDPGEVLGWLDQMGSELESYAGRMTSMLESAIDEDTLESASARLTDNGLRITQAGPLLVPGNDIPLAWALLATRANG